MIWINIYKKSYLYIDYAARDLGFFVLTFSLAIVINICLCVNSNDIMSGLLAVCFDLYHVNIRCFFVHFYIIAV